MLYQCPAPPGHTAGDQAHSPCPGLRPCRPGLSVYGADGFGMRPVYSPGSCAARRGYVPANREKMFGNAVGACLMVVAAFRSMRGMLFSSEEYRRAKRDLKEPPCSSSAGTKKKTGSAREPVDSSLGLVRGGWIRTFRSCRPFRGRSRRPLRQGRTRRRSRPFRAPWPCRCQSPFRGRSRR